MTKELKEKLLDIMKGTNDNWIDEGINMEVTGYTNNIKFKIDPPDAKTLEEIESFDVQLEICEGSENRNYVKLKD